MNAKSIFNFLYLFIFSVTVILFLIITLVESIPHWVSLIRTMPEAQIQDKTWYLAFKGDFIFYVMLSFFYLESIWRLSRKSLTRKILTLIGYLWSAWFYLLILIPNSENIRPGGPLVIYTAILFYILSICVGIFEKIYIKLREL